MHGQSIMRRAATVFGMAAAWAAAFILSSATAATLVVIAPHPDDAEASCGGLIANAVAAGDTAIVLTMTGGELGIGGKPAEQARAVRADEARRAAAELGARIEFFGAQDGALVADAAAGARLEALLVRLKPDVVTAPWPLDLHPDHQAAGLLAWRAFLASRPGFALHFYETANLPHTRSFGFVPTDYVDVSGVAVRKRAAVLLHASQDPQAWYGLYEIMMQSRGYETDVPLAEAYVRARPAAGLGGRAGGAGKTLPAAR